MSTVKWMTDFSMENGRTNLSYYTLGLIKGILVDSCKADKKVLDISETLIALDHVSRDESLPWIIKETPFAEGATEECIHIDNTTEWSCEEIVRSDG